MVYFEFAPQVLSALETQGFDWASLRGFADSMLNKIASKHFLRLKEEAHVPADLKVLDVQLAC